MSGNRYSSRLSSRRTLLRKLATLAGASAVWPYARTFASETAPLSSVRLSEGVVAVLGPGANVLCADSDEGVVMIDGGHAKWSESLLGMVTREFTSRPVTALLNTHWHPEQTGSNVTLGERGVPIIAHENTRLWLSTEVWVRWSDIKYPPLPPAGVPTETFYDSRNIEIGGRRIECGYIPKSHTDGDIFAFLPDENVLVTGGPVTSDSWPLLDWWTGGWTGGMLDGLDSLLAVADRNTRIVPASGPLLTMGELAAQRAMYDDVFGRVHELLLQAKDIAEVVAAEPTRGYHPEWGDPTLFVTLALQSTWGHLRDLYDHHLPSIP